ncbi:MAG: FmdB family zinc ribbon protein [Phycisphaerae bacterium]
MPIFEYTCAECQHEFELFLHSAGKRGKAGNCPTCGSAKIERRFSVFAARDQGMSSEAPLGGGCGRCGDPQGPCGN